MRLQRYCFLLLLTLCFYPSNQIWATTDQLSLDGAWQITTDADNSGRDKNWSRNIAEDAVECSVPSILQQTFPDYNGLVWYWREFEVPTSFQKSGRFLLHFEQVDYYGEFWLNGTLIGKHEGGETPFFFDVTDAIRPDGKNRIAVRVLNPTHDEIDGIVFSQTPRRCKRFPYGDGAGATFNHGGMTGSVRLEAVPNVYLEDVFVDARIDGRVNVEITVNNASDSIQTGSLELCISDGRQGDTVISINQDQNLPKGKSTLEMTTKCDNPKLWELNAPALYRATVRLSVNHSQNGTNKDFSEKSARFGFRDFRFENGYFRLNGKRVFLKSTHTVNNYPIGLQFPHDPDLWRRDLLNLKAMGFNMVRFIWGGAFPEQLDYCDEIGLMVYDESYASADIQNSPFTEKRWHDSVSELIKRDRNHPSIVIWGLLNEIRAESVIFQFALNSLPFVREFDTSRLVMLNSGRWDKMLSGGMDPRIQLCSGKMQEPFVGKNPTNELVSTLSIEWPAGALALHPGENNEYSVVRWIAPESGKININATFLGYASHATTDVHLFLRGESLWDSFINLNGQGNSVSYENSELSVEKGDTLDFIVGSGNKSYGGDTTGLAATISLNEKNWDVAKDFSMELSADSCWSYGSLAASDVPDVTQWASYKSSQGLQSQTEAGTLANPDSVIWEDLVQDTHPYQRVPHTYGIIKDLRTTRGYYPESDQPLYLSEYGIGSAVDLIRTVRFFEQNHAENLCDAKYYRSLLDKYEIDWKKWRLDEAFDRPEDFFAQSITKVAGQRTIGLNAIRSNPIIVGHNLTGGVDHVLTGEGLTTPFRELKPGTIDAIFDAWSSLRWSVFAEPIHLYRGKTLHIEAVISNEDVLLPGDWPARAEIFDEKGQKVYSKEFTVTIDPPQEKEPPFAKLCFTDDVPFDFPTGTYRFVTTLEKGGAAAGGEVRFYVTDSKDLPTVSRPVLLWNDDQEFLQWSREHGIQMTLANAQNVKSDSFIIVTTGGEQQNCDAKALETALRNGSTVLFLCPSYFDNAAARDIFLKDKGTFDRINSWLYLKDEWSKRHPFFDGMPSGGLMDNQYYREIIPDVCFMDVTPPQAAIAGAIKASQHYSSGLMLAVYECGSGKMILSTFQIREMLDANPAGEHLLKNIIKYANGNDSL